MVVVLDIWKRKDLACVKKNKHSKSAQRTAANIASMLMFAQSMDDIDRIYGNIFEEYHLALDPFTKTPCTAEEYYDSQQEYEKQIMINKYGYEV